MFIVSAKIKPKKAIIGILVFGGILIAVILLVAHMKNQSRPAEMPLTAATEEDQISYLAALGWQVEPTPMETLTFTLPSPLSEAYLEYNELQLEQGFDLSAYAGKDVIRYSYAVLNYPGRSEDVQADLYLCADTIIGGDILCCGDNGFVASLTYPD